MTMMWKINISAVKRNVFFSISDQHNKIRRLLTPGMLLKSGVRKDEYKSLSDKKDRRRKRSLRLFLNRQKLSPPACAQAWNLLYSYILEKKLKFQKFILVLGGSNLKTSKHLGRNILKKSKLNITQIVTKTMPPHNGCPLKIRKRKKNKGRNRRFKRGLQVTKKKLAVPRNFTSIINDEFFQVHGIKYWLSKRLKKATVFSKMRLRQRRKRYHKIKKTKSFIL